MPSDPDYLDRLRDECAQAALGSFSDPNLLVTMNQQARQEGLDLPAALAKHAYELADAMLKARERR